MSPHIIPIGKRGYLYKWQDRQIGLGGSKWDLRFVVLEKGRLAYYRSHRDLSPRYVLNLKGCVVREDGIKERKGYIYFVFSICQIPKCDEDDHSKITPLLRFSTTNVADKTHWIERLSEACAYCDSSYYRTDNENPGDFMILQQEPATPNPQSKLGTLPPFVFAEPAKKYRRKSVSSKKDFKQKIDYPPSRPMHKAAEPSLLSSEAPRQNYRGFLNLGFIILIISNFRLMVDTIRRNGSILTHYSNWSDIVILSPIENYPTVFGLAVIQVFLVLTYFTELFLSKHMISEKLGMMVHFVIISLSLIVPIIYTWYFIPLHAQSSIFLTQGIITWMKIVSYVHANFDYRTSVHDSCKATLALVRDLDEKEFSYPENITLSNLYYFWLAPTLTYQIGFPRSSSIRFTYIFYIVFRFILGFSILLYIFAQVIVPNLENLIDDYESKQITLSLGVEYVLKLAIANTYIWLLFFYLFFHLFFNFLAEILRFGDRVFYKDWWNCSDIGSYWRLWNLPVHYWLVRHVYFPLIRLNMKKNVASFTIFFLSALLHEVMVSVPLKMIRCYSFLGMIGQVPLVTLSSYLEKRNPGGSLGNYLFWISFCIVGQPMAIALYTIDYWTTRNSSCEGP